MFKLGSLPIPAKSTIGLPERLSLLVFIDVSCPFTISPAFIKNIPF